MNTKPDSLSAKLWAAEKRSADAAATLAAAHSLAAKALAAHAASRPRDFDEAAAQDAIARAEVIDATENTTTAAEVRARIAAARESSAVAVSEHAKTLAELTAEEAQAKANAEQARRVLAELKASRVVAVATAARERLSEAKAVYCELLLQLADIFSDVLALRSLARSTDRTERDATNTEGLTFVASALWAVDAEARGADLRDLGLVHHHDAEGGVVRIEPQASRLVALKDFWRIAGELCDADPEEIANRGQSMPVKVA